jgi:excisionase family DNA binding protein
LVDVGRMGRFDMEKNFTSETAAIIRRGKGTLTVPELSAIISLSGKTLYRLASSNKIPHFKLGYTIRFDRNAVADWLDAQTRLCA